MTYTQTEVLLSGFPKLFKSVIIRRNNILYGSNAGPSLIGIRRSGHSDSTGSKAIALADLSGTIKLLTVIRKWIDTQLAAKDRSLLIYIWRAETWPQIARKQRQGVAACQSRWRQMILNLRAYAGAASGQGGVAYAVGLPINQKAL